MYSASITAGSLKMAESRILAGLLLRGISSEEWQSAVTAENVLQARNPATAVRVARLIRQRLELMAPKHWRLVVDGDATVATHALLAAAVKHSRLLGDFLDLVVREQLRVFSSAVLDAYKKNTPLGEWVPVKEGMNTGDNSRFHRDWPEVSFQRIAFDCVSSEVAIKSGCRWFPTNKGGSFRRWYGNNYVVVNWENDGKEIREYSGSAVRNAQYYFSPGITWSCITSSISARQFDSGFVFNSAGRCLFPPGCTLGILGLLNSPTGQLFLKLTSQMQFAVGDVAALPFSPELHTHLADEVSPEVERLVDIYRQDWDDVETSWDFRCDAVVSQAS